MTHARDFPWRAAALVLALVVSGALPPAREADAIASWSVPHYAFEVNLDYELHRVSAVEQVTIPNSFGVSVPELVFNVPPAHGIGTFYVQDVRVGARPAEFDLTGTALTVTLPAPLAPAQVVTVTFDFVLYVEPLGRQVASFATANLAYTDDALTLGYWYPMLAPYRPGEGWRLVPWSPMGDPFASESADYSATITATPGVAIVAGGDMTRTGNVWQFELPRGRTFGLIASDKYAQSDATVDGVTHSVYTLPQHNRLAPVALETVARAAQLYTALYGPYPYSALRVAEVSGPWSMEFSGLVALGHDEFASYNGTPRNRLVRIAAHEVAHQWWYSVVGNDQAREPWLDEALARFSELRYYEFYSPGDAGWWRAVTGVSSPYPVDSAVYDFSHHLSYIGAVYDQGAALFDTLRAQIGDEAFDALMRRYYRDNQFRLVTAQDVFAELSAYPEVDWVLRRYLKNPPALFVPDVVEPGVPRLTYKYPAKPCALPQ
jgi:hypothetical protein